jgi:O-antigen chain-terminating methyltransferase
VQFLRSVADLQSAFQHRATLMEGNFRDIAGSQHRDFTVALDKARLDIQERLWADLAKVREEFERLIHNELRVARQRLSAQPPVAVHAGEIPASPPGPAIDYLRFADRFRGSEQYVRENMRRYARRFEGCAEVVDLGCGRGEFLEVMRDAGINARGIELSEELAAICRGKGLAVEHGDMFAHLRSLDDASLDGIFSGQVVEHLPPEVVTDFVRLAAAKLRRGGRLVIETPNPECLAIFATHFYIDPTHVRPIPASLLVFYFEEFGLGQIEVELVNPAIESMPEVAQLSDGFRNKFFGALDYAICGRRL